MSKLILPARNGPEKQKASYLLALFAFFFPFAFCGCGGALRMRLSAASKGTGVLSGFGWFGIGAW